MPSIIIIYYNKYLFNFKQEDSSHEKLIIFRPNYLEDIAHINFCVK